MAKGSVDKGMFNFQGVMNKFYGYEPGKNDSEGRAIKNSFMANMVQSGFDAQMAKDMAQQQSGIAQSNMTLAADLEARNTSVNMKQEFNYGMQSMGAQYEYQNKFANNQYKRDLGTISATGEQNRKNIGASGAQDRLTSVVQGEQSRKNIGAQGTQDRKNISATGTESRKNIGAQGSEDRKGYVTQGEQARKTIGTQGSEDRKNISATGEQQRETDSNRINVQGEQDRKGYVTQGEQARETLGYQDQLAAGKANRESARSRAMARSF